MPQLLVGPGRLGSAEVRSQSKIRRKFLGPTSMVLPADLALAQYPRWFACGVDGLLCDAGSLELEPCRVGVDFGIVTGLADVLDTPKPQCQGGDHARN